MNELLQRGHFTKRIFKYEITNKEISIPAVDKDNLSDLVRINVTATEGMNRTNNETQSIILRRIYLAPLISA